MKRILVLLLVSVLLLCCCGCEKAETGAFRTLEVIGTKQYSVICRSGDRLAPVIDAAMESLAASGRLSAISAQWLGKDVITLEGSADALADTDAEAAERTLIVGVEADFNPMAFLRDGELVGMSVDIGKALGELLGWEVAFQPITPSEVGTQLTSGNIDCAIGFDSGLVSASKYAVGVSYMESRIVLAVRSGSEIDRIRDIRGERIGTVEDPAVQSAVRSSEKVTKYASGATVYLSAERCVTALDNGWCSAVAMDSLMLSYFSYN